MADTYVELISQLSINWTQYSASARRVFRYEPTAKEEEGAIVESDLPTWGDIYNVNWNALNSNMVPEPSVQNRLIVVGITAEWPDDENYELTYQYEAPNNGGATSNIIIPSGGSVIGTKSFSMSHEDVVIDAEAIDGGIGWHWWYETQQDSSGAGDVAVENHPIVVPFITATFEITEYFSTLDDAVSSSEGKVGMLGYWNTSYDYEEWLFVGVDIQEAMQANGKEAYTARRKYEYKHNIPGRESSSPVSHASSWNIRWNKNLGDWDVALDGNDNNPYRYVDSSRLPDHEFLPIPHLINAGQSSPN